MLVYYKQLVPVVITLVMKMKKEEKEEKQKKNITCQIDMNSEADRHGVKFSIETVCNFYCPDDRNFCFHKQDTPGEHCIVRGDFKQSLHKLGIARDRQNR
ncbi:hypothetical protein ElyMa_005106500 [Elysia marginata]|uniref:Uncharacterized protein n=1 Tax=Elysia marginata TaxID=1093978 RepID=A0AAV4JJD3_9GAST|nr:hypothetical protein ElyMa_005106500 [Elysia marginata]